MRIISLIPSATEIVALLGLESQLVGVTHECDYPPSVREVRKVTRTHIPTNASSAEIDRLVAQQRDQGRALYSLDFDACRELKPDLMITQTLCDVCAVDDFEVKKFVTSIASSGHKTNVVYLEPTRLGEVLESITTVGKATGTIAAARTATIELRARIERVRGAVAEKRAAGQLSRSTAPERIRVTAAPGSTGFVVNSPRVAVIEWLDPLFSSGHWTPELVEIAGGIEPLARAGERSRQIAHEELMTADPDVMLIACCGYDIARTMQDVPAFLADSRTRGLRCVRDGRVYVTDGSAYFSRPGPRLVDSLEIVAAAIRGAAHPALHAVDSGA